MNTILHTFLDRVKDNSDKEAALVKDVRADRWISISWSDLKKDVERMASLLLSVGVKEGEYVAIYADTCYEWSVIDMAILSIGAITVPIYKNLSRSQVKYVLEHSSSKAVFAHNRKLSFVIDEIRGELDSLENVLFIDELFFSYRSSREKEVQYGDQVDLDKLIMKRKLEDVATCIYTSGTTGELKGALITHANIIGEVKGLLNIYNFGAENRTLLFLPLAHVIGRAFQFFQIAVGVVTAYAESLEKLEDNIRETKPEFIVLVPRLIEKIYERILERVEASSSFRKFLFNKSLVIGKKLSAKMRLKIPLSAIERIQHFIISKIIFRELHGRLGGRLRQMMVGGAPLHKDLAEFFHATGIFIFEGYGLTETFAAVTLNHPEDYKFGTVGKPLKGVNIKISDDGEVLIQGPQVFTGYKEPLPESAFEPFDNGWLKTGDLGEFSRDGFLRITGRKKEIIVTAQGKNVAPQLVESIIKKSPFIKDIYVYGDSRKYLSALILPDKTRLGSFAREKGLSYKNEDDLLASSDTYQLIKNEIEGRNRELARHETIKKFAIIKNELSMESGELTPTLKVRRHKLFDRYKDVIEGLYS